MKIYGKITLLAIGVAAVSSALTALAVNSIQNNSTGNGLASVSENPIQRRGALYTASHTVTPPTDFTSAAESTVNGVVSIKSYATPRSRGSYGNNGGGYYIDPFEFFFGSPQGGGSLPVIPVGDSDALRVGEWVLAVGNPFGFTSTVTTGIVSAKARSVGAAARGRAMGIESYIQTDAAVNPGNSGGALVNINGELVGINTAIYSETGNYIGYSFAIPTSIVTKIVTDIKQYGSVQRAVLGVLFTELTPQIAKEKGITATNDGIYVEEVNDRSAALEAGIEKGDVIVSINGAPTHNTAQLQGEISKYRPGDKITLGYIRDNKTRSASVTLRNSQGGTQVTKSSDFTALGCAFKELSAELLREFRLSGGVQVKALTHG